MQRYVYLINSVYLCENYFTSNWKNDTDMAITIPDQNYHTITVPNGTQVSVLNTNTPNVRALFVKPDGGMDERHYAINNGVLHLFLTDATLMAIATVIMKKGIRWELPKAVIISDGGDEVSSILEYQK